MSSAIAPYVIVNSFKSSPTALFLLDLETPGFPIAEVNHSLENLTGLPRERLMGQPRSTILGEDGGFGSLERSLHERSPVEVTGYCQPGSGVSFWGRVRMRMVQDDASRVTHAICALHDVSKHVEAENTSEYLVKHDPLSGLIRTHVFERNMMAELVHALQQCYRLVLCYVDIDKFGVINETHGFNTGDRLIRILSERLTGCAQDERLMCRMAGDEFVMMFVDKESREDQVEIGHKLLETISAPIRMSPLNLRLTASIGVSCFPDTATSGDELMQQASLAMRMAKREGGNEVQVFSPAQRQNMTERLRLGAKLHGAVEREELELHYQPVVGALKREITGMEALVRWRNPELGLVMPERFISLAEDFGMIAEIGRWVLKEACQQARRWLDQGAGDFVLSVNVSGMQMRGQQLLEDVSRALSAARLPADRLELELTETVIMSNLEHVASVMKELRKMGVKLAMDDFGIGQSSLGYLQRLPINRLKIDRSFVSVVPDDVSATRICRAVLGLAHEFGFAVVAEGVETPVQLAFLERNGCEFIQGNFFSKPILPDAMLTMMRRPVLRPREENVATRSGSILLVDDEQNVLRALARLLRREGYRIFTAATFRDAFEILGTEEIDVVVSDHRMPDGKGTEFLGRVKETHPHTVRMILSGYADLGVVTEAINGGAVYRFLTKPWNDEELRKTLHEAVRMAQPEEARSTH